MKYGRSLSLCVKDILSGKVNKMDVGCIVTSTNLPDMETWEKTINQYNKTYWKGYSKKEIKDLINYLIDNNKILQPRMWDDNLMQALYDYPIWGETLLDVLTSLVYQ